ncbi:MAG: DUF1257 domain-containing protein [Planctomycetaceae bacterium]
MSHIVQIQSELRDPVAVAAACERLRLPPPVLGDARLYSGAKTGWQVRLPGWRYPVVCDVDSGRADYDNFGGRWGELSQLHRLLQAYAVEKTRLEARRRGHVVTEQPLADGSIRVTVQIGGAA